MSSQPAEGESASRPSSSPPSSSSAQRRCAAPVDGAHTVGCAGRCARAGSTGAAEAGGVKG